MDRLFLPLRLMGVLLIAAGCSSAPAATSDPAPTPRAAPAGRPGQEPGGPGQSPGRRPGGQAPSSQGPKDYSEVITDEAITKSGIFALHQVGDDLFFEIPQSEFGSEFMLLPRRVEWSRQGGFFPGGGSKVVVFNRSGNWVTLQEKRYQVLADEDASISRATDAMSKGAVIDRFGIEAFSDDSNAVINVTGLFTSTNPEINSLQGVQRNRSFVDKFSVSATNVEVEAVQTGMSRPQAGGFGPQPPGPPGGGGGQNNQARAETARLHWSFQRLADEPMMPRLHDRRVGFNSFAYVDYSRPEHRAESRRYIRRFRLEKANPTQSVSEPVAPIIYWIDPATPEWLKPWVKSGVDAWQGAFEEAGFRGGIRGEVAPTDDPDWSLYALGNSAIYWRPSTVPNATGGQIWDPRSGEILKGEVNMYHNVMNLLRNWYFIQVSPLDPRAQSLPLPDSLMGRLVEYVVTHEIGHSIGFPHNMKASSQYPADSIRSASFLRRMGGHVATLMDYSRFNYVVQPEDNVPVELLIPTVGPYDRFALKWGYSQLDASSPDDEWATLDSWSRMQDTIPWFRWSTQESRNDPGNLTEAVGDEDAVYSTGLALRNLRRVMEMLVPVTEEPGRNYDLMEELYNNAVQQWGRYMAHVAAIIGGAQTQEKYGTGSRFDPESRARQVEAMQFLKDNAFATPEYFVDEAILRRIETDGVLQRLRRAQGQVLQNLINPRRVERLLEYEALAPNASQAYSVTDLMNDLRDGVWGELASQRVSIDAYRRNLQRAYLEAVDRQLNPPPARPQQGPGGFGQQQQPPLAVSDIRPLLRGALKDLDRAAEQAAGRAANSMTRLHLDDVRMEIDRILNPTD